MNIKTIIERLKQAGYTIELEIGDLYDFVTVTGQNVIGGFCSPHDPNSVGASYSYLNGKIAIDHVDCFDKWSKCPLILPLPTNDGQMDYLLSQLKFWDSNDGLEASRNYEYEKWVDDYPKTLQV
ncbi:hypothetical protein PP175_25915 (plasmid) [Aneurinibacillus sp. Ricciae_BoGa-3]|uniref:hypothetical protein n=1 Tax=Aneurinibacillus sp. Ricciae_BoGa-3 TaxID=3022697 RepID=UPI00233F8FCC|nr:hypothetical protein [Aneurinibacillus sp. Ricciae_BoGa-3]WCK57506.1 hypothetical protein PP175_25915 [Aneurinibacillus sp. Ricciae_BoGa-3]